MNKLLENVDPVDIFNFARQVPIPENFLLTREIVPNRLIDGIKWRTRRSERRISTAKFRAYDAPTPYGRREISHDFLEGLLPPIGTVFKVGELETILLNMERGADDSELISRLYDDVEAHPLGIYARAEKAAGQLLESGVFELVDENGLTLRADFEVPAAALPTAATLWSDPSAPAITHERTWVEWLADTGDGAPGEAITSTTILRALATNTQYKQVLYNTNTLAEAATRPTLLPAQVNEVRARAGLVPVRAYDTKVYVDGVETRCLRPEKFVLVPENKQSFAETQYGITAEAITLSRNGNPRIEREELPGICITAGETDNPVSAYTKSAATMMPVMYANDAMVSARVLA